MKKVLIGRRSMMALLVGILVLLSVFYPNTGMGIEKLSLEISSNNKIDLQGYFSRSGIAEPGDTIFEYYEGNEYVFQSNTYIFAGRVGDRNFELEYKPGGLGTNPTLRPTKLNVYYTKGGTFSLKISTTKCGSEQEEDLERVYLKMINLSGNKLEYQIILPECIKQFDRKYIKQ